MLAGRVLAKGGPMAVPGASLVAGVAEIDTTDEHGDFSVDLPFGPTMLSVFLAAPFERLTTTIDACRGGARAARVSAAPRGSCFARETVVRATSPLPAAGGLAEELVKTLATLGDPLLGDRVAPRCRRTLAWPAPLYAVRGSNPEHLASSWTASHPHKQSLKGPSVIHPYFFGGL